MFEFNTISYRTVECSTVNLNLNSETNKISSKKNQSYIPNTNTWYRYAYVDSSRRLMTQIPNFFLNSNRIRPSFVFNYFLETFWSA